MAKQIKFTKKELDQINELRQKIGQSFAQIGQLHLEKKRRVQEVDQQILQVEGNYTTLVQEEQQLFTELNKTYGDGNFDPETGVFTPTVKESTEAVTTPPVPVAIEFNLEIPYERALALEFMAIAHVHLNSVQLKAVYIDEATLDRVIASDDDEVSEEDFVKLSLRFSEDSSLSPIHKTAVTNDPAPPRFARRRKLVEGMIVAGIITVPKLEGFFETMQLKPDRIIMCYIVDLISDTIEVHDLNGDSFLEALLDALWLAIIAALDGVFKYAPVMHPDKLEDEELEGKASSGELQGRRSRMQSTGGMRIPHP